MSKLPLTRKILACVGIAGLFAAATCTAQSASTWDQEHPRRAEVNARLGNQNARIDNKLANGTMSPAQAQQLHHEDHQIHQEEHDMASQNGGHITRSEQRTLNQQENHVSHQIHNE